MQFLEVCIFTGNKWAKDCEEYQKLFVCGLKYYQFRISHGKMLNIPSFIL